MIKCEFCGAEKDIRGFKNHILFCKKNPKNIKVKNEIVVIPKQEHEKGCGCSECKAKTEPEKLLEIAKKELKTEEKKEEVAPNVSSEPTPELQEEKKDDYGWVIGLVLFIIAIVGAVIYLIKTGSIPFFNEEKK